MRIKVVGVVVAIVAAFACGRYLTPEKVRTVTKIVEVKNEKDDRSVDTDKHKETTVVVVENPNGTKTTTTTTTEDTNKKVDEHKTTDTTKTTDTVKEVVYAKNRWSLSALAGANSLFPPAPVVYGGHVTYSFLGPITVGVWGLSNLTFGASLGLSL